MQHNGIGRTSIVIATGLIISAAVAGIQIYVVRELLVALMFLCILFTVIGIAVAVFLVIDEVGSRAVLRLRTQIARAHLPRHATLVGAVVSAAHKSQD
jgi:hypothetical protein